MPFDRNEEFIGRYALLESLHTILCNVIIGKWNHRVALHGMGGVGKTQTAMAYVYKYKDNYDRIYWISAATEATLLTGFQNIASKTGCAIECDPKKQAAAIISWLRHHSIRPPYIIVAFETFIDFFTIYQDWRSVGVQLYDLVKIASPDYGTGDPWGENSILMPSQYIPPVPEDVCETLNPQLKIKIERKNHLNIR